jgi:hypothetical protein
VSRDKLWPEGYVEELYVDALEGELDAEFEKDLAIWLKNSNSTDEPTSGNSVNAVELEKLSQIRQGLKNSDDVTVPESGAYYDALEARIMASLDHAIESGDVEDRSPETATGAASTEASNHSTLQLRLKNEKSETTESEKVPQGLVAQAAKLQRRTLSIRAGQLAILAGLALLTTGKWLIGPSVSNLTASTVESSVANHLRATHRAAPEVLTGTVISFESEADLALEIAARRLVAYHKGE